MGHLGDELLELFDLPSEASTLITGGGDKSVARETIDRLSEAMRIKVGLAKLGFAMERVNENMEKQNGRIGKQETQCADIQAGKTPYGCGHLENLKSTFWRFVAVSFTLPIVITLVIAGIMWAVK